MGLFALTDGKLASSRKRSQALLPGHGAQATYRVSDTGHGYAADTAPIRVRGVSG